jgi:hypothetical protein
VKDADATGASGAGDLERVAHLLERGHAGGDDERRAGAAAAAIRAS